MLGALWMAFGVATELVLGSFRHLFDLRWARKRYPIGGNWVAVLGGRLFLLVGVLLVVGSPIALA